LDIFGTSRQKNEKSFHNSYLYVCNLLGEKTDSGEMQAGWKATCLIASLKVFEEMPKI